MARKSRIAENAITVSTANNGFYKTAVYARLSSEDVDEDTLDNQIYLLKTYVNENTELNLTDIYADNGFSGTNFDRPEFNRLMSDIKAGKINCIVVKDLSRLGRNYIETGTLLESVFPFLNVRFIAVTDGFDTNDGNGTEAMIVSLKNLVNDVYAKDISRKILTSFRTKQKNGEFIGMVAPYGYLKSPENKNKFIIDEVTVQVVRLIYELYLQGYGVDRIARMLNEAGYDSPRKYRTKIGITKSSRYKDSKWGRSAVMTIITNRAYIGDMVQGKVKQELCNNVQRHYTDKEDWIIAEGTHEPIIDREIFFKVQELLAKRKKEQAERKARSQAKDFKEENYFRGVIRCGCCGKPMNLAQTVRYGKPTRTYYCVGYKEFREQYCSNKRRVKKEVIENTVFQSIQAFILQMLDETKIADIAPQVNVADDRKKIAAVERELQKLRNRTTDLYQDMTEGILDQNDYISMKEEYARQMEVLDLKLASLKKKIVDQKEKELYASGYEQLKKYRKQRKLDQKLVDAFVEQILVHNAEHIEIRFKGTDFMSQSLEG